MQQGVAAQPSPTMTMMVSVKTCLRKYADFNGRATRAEFWWWLLAVTLAGVAVNVLEYILKFFLLGLFPLPYGFYIVDPLSSLFALATILPGLAVTVRRLHDIGKSGWWQLVWIAIGAAGVIPLAAGITLSVVSALSEGSGWDALGEPSFWIPIAVGFVISFLMWIGLFIWWLIWMVTQGQAGPNIYGPDPRAWETSPAGQGTVQ